MQDGPAAINAKARYWPEIVIFVPVSWYQSEYCHNVWYRIEKLEWSGYPTVKKI